MTDSKTQLSHPKNSVMAPRIYHMILTVSLSGYWALLPCQNYSDLLLLLPVGMVSSVYNSPFLKQMKSTIAMQNLNDMHEIASYTIQKTKGESSFCNKGLREMKQLSTATVKEREQPIELCFLLPKKMKRANLAKMYFLHSTINF